jgi:hypothetical protein
MGPESGIINCPDMPVTGTGKNRFWGILPRPISLTFAFS